MLYTKPLKIMTSSENTIASLQRQLDQALRAIYNRDFAAAYRKDLKNTKKIRIQFVPFVILISHDTNAVMKIYQDDKGLNDFLGYGWDVFEKITNEMFDYSEQQEILMTERN